MKDESQFPRVKMKVQDKVGLPGNIQRLGFVIQSHTESRSMNI